MNTKFFKLSFISFFFLPIDSYGDDRTAFFNLMKKATLHRSCIQSLCGSVDQNINKEALRDSLDKELTNTDDLIMYENYSRRINLILIKHKLSRDYSNTLRNIFHVKLKRTEVEYFKSILSTLINAAIKAIQIEDPVFLDFFKGVEVSIPPSFDESITKIDKILSLANAEKNSSKVEEILEGFFTDYGDFGRAFYDYLEGVNKGKLVISWASVRYPQYGIPTVLHELGHQFSWTISSLRKTQLRGEFLYKSPFHSRVWEARSCLDNNNTNSTIAIQNSFIPEERAITEEKWADFFAQYAVLHLPKNFQTNIKPSGCVGIQSFEGFYLPDRFFVDEGLHTRRNDETHPLRFDRLLEMSTLLYRDLPKTCSSFEQEYRRINCSL